MKKHHGRIAVVSTTLAGLLALSAVAWAATTSIRHARDLALGTTVTVEGVVTTPSGAFQPNDGGFAIQTGNAGIYVHDALGGSYAVGQKVRVTGALAQSFGQVLGVQPTAIERRGSGHVPNAARVRTGEVDEDTEGRLVRVRGVVTDAVFDDAPYGWIFHVDDGSDPITIFVYTGTGIDVSEIDEGDEIEVTGFSGQFLDHYEIDPRFQSDLELVEDCH